MKSIALVDLNSFTVRHFKARANDSGPNDAAEATLSDLCAIRDSVEHVILALDAPPYRRKKEFDAYKAHRPPQEPELIQIKKWLFNRLDLDGWVMAKYPGEEGEDIVGTLAVAYYDRCEDIRLCGADKDLAALVNDRVRMFIPAIGARGPEIRGPAEVKQKFGVEPRHMALYLALCGDTADGIPGVPKWGPVTASKWINETGGDLLKMGVELAKQTELGPKMPMLWKHFASVYEQIPLWVRLTTLRCDVPIDADALLIKRYVQPLVEVSDADDSEFYDPNEERELMASDDATQGFIPFGEGELRPGKVPTRAAGVASEPPAFTHDVHGNKLPKSPAPEKSGSTFAAGAESSIAMNEQNVPPAKTMSTESAPSVTGRSEAGTAASVVPPTQGPARPRRVDALEQSAIVVAPPSWALATQPNSAGDAFSIAVKLMNSRLYARFGTVEAIAAVIIRGRELGLGMTTALDAFHVIEGRPSCSAQLISALAERDPNHEWTRMLSSSATEATFQCKDKRFPEPSIPFTYTIEEADAIGLLKPSRRTGEPSQWVKRPRDMLIKTAKSKLHKIMFPGATLGLHAIEEEPEE